MIYASQVVTGHGGASRFMVEERFPADWFDYEPIPGTLNVAYDEALLPPDESEALQPHPAVMWHLWPVTVEDGYLGHLILSPRFRQLELACEVHLRTVLGLVDGDEVTWTLR